MEIGYAVRSDAVYWKEERKLKGQYRVDIVVKELMCKGYKVHSFPVEANGLDVIAENDKEVLGIVVLNWNERWTLRLKRLKSMINNWDNLLEELNSKGDKRKYRRILVYSYLHNIKNVIPYLLSLNVELWERGYQYLPEEQNETIEGWYNE